MFGFWGLESPRIEKSKILFDHYSSTYSESCSFSPWFQSMGLVSTKGFRFIKFLFSKQYLCKPRRFQINLDPFYEFIVYIERTSVKWVWLIVLHINI